MKLASDVPEPNLRADGMRFVIVAARFNSKIVGKLVDGAASILAERGAKPLPWVEWVPGALELPLAAQIMIKQVKPDAIVALGCVIEGGTDHYEHVCRATIDGLMRVTLDTGVPVGNGVLTVATLEQAEERAGGRVGNKGAEAALAALEMVHVMRSRPWA